MTNDNLFNNVLKARLSSCFKNFPIHVSKRDYVIHVLSVDARDFLREGLIDLDRCNRWIVFAENCANSI